jgi:O-acetyl-ADP-ribose deacetylase (regulator of RNase III)
MDPIRLKAWMESRSFVVVVAVTAGIFLVLCLATLWWATRASSVGVRHTLFVFVWLCAALTATLVTFSLFPSSTADGTVFGVTLGGAGAFVILLWTAALRAGNRAADRDRREAAAVRKAMEAAAQRDTTAAARSAVIARQETHWYRLRHTAGPGKRWIGIITGDVRRVTEADAWVNSENTDMMMSRVHEFSMSGIIRYEGSRRDATGRVLADIIADELALAVRDRRPVTPAVAIVTSGGELARTHGVRLIIHSAAVEGQPGSGYRAIPDLGQAVQHALAAAAHPTLPDGTPAEPARTVLFPLIGTGTAGGDLDESARTLLLAVVDHLAHSSDPAPERVIFLAYTEAELIACRRVLDACPDVTNRQTAAA